MKWVIAILLTLNLCLGIYGFGQTYTTLNLYRDLNFREIRDLSYDLEEVEDLLRSLGANHTDDYLMLLEQRYILQIEEAERLQIESDD